MPIFDDSRYARSLFSTVIDADDESYEVPFLQQTTVVTDEQPQSEFQWYTVRHGQNFEDIADDVYFDAGGADLWWVLAACNPHIFYPADLAAGDNIIVPSGEWVEEYVAALDDWEATWQSVIR